MQFPSWPLFQPEFVDIFVESLTPDIGPQSMLTGTSVISEVKLGEHEADNTPAPKNPAILVLEGFLTSLQIRNLSFSLPIVS